MWAAGVQLVALNWQTFGTKPVARFHGLRLIVLLPIDVGMELNSAMFSRAGRSGYVLKPDLLRKKGLEKDKVAMLRSEKYKIEVEVSLASSI